MADEYGWLLRKNSKGKYVIQAFYNDVNTCLPPDEANLQYQSLVVAVAAYEFELVSGTIRSELGLLVLI